MLKLKSAKRSWVLGLIAILCTYNMAYANVKVRENKGILPATERTNRSDNVGSTPNATVDVSATKAQSITKKAPVKKNPATVANNCACSCTSTTRRSAALPDAFWNCVKGCLRSWGVSPVQLAICGATCALGIVPLCAFCVGVDVSLFMLCANGCAVYAGGFETGEGHVPILTRKTPDKGKKNAERSVSAFAARK